MTDKSVAKAPAACTPSTSASDPADPALDVASEQFDPLKALYARSESIPTIRKARLYDNIGKYESAVNAQSESPATCTAGSSTSTSAARSTANDEAAATFQRKFRPEQLMLPGTGVKARHKRNLPDRLANSSGFEGPLALLQRYMTTAVRVRVYTRNASGIDGHISGVVQMFDKHWNMALSDVHEVWKRRKAFQCATADPHPAAADDGRGVVDDDTDVDECSRRLRELRIRLPTVAVRSLNRKYVECSRRLDKAMVRGEQVVLVTPCRNDRTDAPVASHSDRGAKPGIVS